jgi:hypothetical protein
MQMNANQQILFLGSAGSIGRALPPPTRHGTLLETGLRMKLGAQACSSIACPTKPARGSKLLQIQSLFVNERRYAAVSRAQRCGPGCRRCRARPMLRL